MTELADNDRVSERLPMPAGYFDLVLRHLGTTPRATAALLEGTGVTLAQFGEPDGEITLGQGLRLLRNANRSFPQGWALDVGQALQPSAHGPLGIAVICAPTLRDAFRVVESACHLRHPAFRAELHEGGGELRLELKPCLALFEEEFLPLIETFLLSFQGFVEAVLGRPMTEGHFEIAASPPPYGALYRQFFHAPVHFGKACSIIGIPAEWSALRCPFANEAMFGVAKRQLGALEERFERLDYTAPHVEHLMMLAGDAGLSLGEAANRLALSERTLVRRLHDEGTTFRDLRDAHRRRRALVLLRDGALTISELSYRLGYEDATNFNRACQRWFGRTPSSLRDKPTKA